MKISTDIKCRCLNVFNVLFSKPGIGRDTTIQTVCPNCESSWIVRFTILPLSQRKTLKEIKYTMTPLRLTPYLLKLLVAEEEFNREQAINND